MQLDYLFFGAHPDDVELSCGGTIAEAVSRNQKIGIIDLTQGELGSRGDEDIRALEAEAAKKILKIEVRQNLKMRDGFFEHSEESILKIITIIRTYRPTFIFANATEDRHPDHSRAAHLIERSCFLSGLIKIKTENLQAFKPQYLFFYIQDKQLEPNIVVDISGFFEEKKKAIAAYKSQFYNSNNNNTEPETYISSQLFWENLETKAKAMGQKIGVLFGEGYISKTNIGCNNLEQILPNLF